MDTQSPIAKLGETTASAGKKALPAPPRRGAHWR